MSTPKVDLKALTHAVSPALLTSGITLAPVRRRVEPLGMPARSISGVEPLPVAVYVDGVQSTLHLTNRADRRPVYVAGVTAGAIDPRIGDVVHIEQRIVVLCSYVDRRWADALPGGCEVIELDARQPEEIAHDSADWIDAARRDAERAVLTAALTDAGLDRAAPWVVLDGSIRDIGHALPGALAPRVIGVVKTVDTQYLHDEHLTVHSLPEGHLSQAFRLPATRRGQVDRASAYLRQRHDPHQPWTWGLVRLEVPNPHRQALPAAAALVLAGRQNGGVGDPRWDRHQGWIYRLEQMLRARTPYPLNGL